MLRTYVPGGILRRSKDPIHVFLLIIISFDSLSPKDKWNNQIGAFQILPVVEWKRTNSLVGLNPANGEECRDVLLFLLGFFWNKTEKGHQCHSTKRPFSFDQFLLFLFKLIITEPFSSDGLHTEDCHHHLFFFLYFCLDVSGSICLDNRMKILGLEKYRQRYSPSESSHLPAGDWLDFEGIYCWPSHRFSYITHISTTTTTTVLLFAIGSQGKLTLRTAGPLQQQQQRFSFLSLV